MIELMWDSLIGSIGPLYESAKTRDAVADAAKGGYWGELLSLLQDNPDLVNSTRRGGDSLFTPLHQAAYMNAPLSVINGLIAFGALRTSENARGERPVDVAERRGHLHLMEPLTPVLKHKVPPGVLRKIQQHFHAVIRHRMEEFRCDAQITLPVLEPLLELPNPKMWCPVPGMYGSFVYWLSTTGVEAILTTTSECRVCGGSEQKHEITPLGSRLVAEGYFDL